MQDKIANLNKEACEIQELELIFALASPSRLPLNAPSPQNQLCPAAPSSPLHPSEFSSSILTLTLISLISLILLILLIHPSIFSFLQPLREPSSQLHAEDPNYRKNLHLLAHKIPLQTTNFHQKIRFLHFTPQFSYLFLIHPPIAHRAVSRPKRIILAFHLANARRTP